MINESIYNSALGFARKTRRLYLSKALEREELEVFNKIDLDDWSLKEREEAYKQEVLPYWKRFGRAPKKFWFEYYGSRDHMMDPGFIPADLFYTEILPYMNDGLQRKGLINKGYLEYLFCDVKQSQTVALKIDGNYCDEKRKLIREDDAIALCRERKEELFLKVSTGTSCGKGITVFTPSDCSEEDIRKLLRGAGANFIIQERIKQHPDLAKLNPTSVVTIRVLSLLMDNKVYIESAGLRVSAPGTSFVTSKDGGFYTLILEDGRMNQKVYSDLGKWYDNGKGIFDDSYRVPSIDRVYDVVRRIHPRVGHFRCIGWDFTIDENGDPVMFEYNVFPGLIIPQITSCRPVFNERTEWLLEDYFSRRSWAENHRQDALIQ